MITSLVLLLGTSSPAAEVTIHIDARHAGRPVSPYLTGACIEDVNHEIYGGIYSQMLFGESFQEPPRREPVKAFMAIEGEWSVDRRELVGGAGAGPKLLSTVAPFTDGEVGVDVLLPGGGGGNAGLVVRVARAGAGADNFDGYEISLDTARKRLALGRHHRDFRLLREEPCEIMTNQWIPLAVRLDQRMIEISVNGKSVLRFEDDHPLGPGTIGLRQWNRSARYRNLWVRTADRRTELPFEALPEDSIAVSGMWDAVATGTAKLAASIEKGRPFIGSQSQRIGFTGGAGEVGIANRGLNHQGLACQQGKPYGGYVWLRTDQPTELLVAMESRDGSRMYATAELRVQPGEWRRYEFTLIPDASDPNCRFSIKLKSPGPVMLGHAFLQPGEWGRFKGLPLRRDVVEELIDQGITVLRYGGSMVNAPEYRWKKMIGPRDRRPPYRGTWYPYSSNGWGIIDFLDLCEATDFLGVPAFNMDESTGDMADFIEYVNGPADSEWGRMRVADGHPKPYGLKYLELGNEERVDERYADKFAALARAIWAKDPQVIPVVGDFAYDAPINDPMHVARAASGITSLIGQQQILKFVKEQGREVWFDVHVGTEGPAPYPSLTALPTYIDAIDKLVDGAKHKVVVFELNANNHSQKRAVGNAQALGVAMRDGRLPIVTSANCLQVDGQNDNGWDQGLLFLNPSKVWLQPPGYVTTMLRQAYQPTVIDAAVQPAVKELDVTATRSEDGKQIVIRVVNIGAELQSASFAFDGFEPRQEVATIERLAADPNAANTADAPDRVAPQKSEWRHKTSEGRSAPLEFPPHSLTVVRFQ